MNPVYRRAKFLLAVQNAEQLPEEVNCEVGFAGRSNAGKSSSINTITGIHSLARTSKTPGRTQQIVYFTLDDDRALVDLPGYGFAKVPPSVKKHWHALMEGYFTNRKELNGLILVMDIRHPMREFDEKMLNWCKHSETPAHILLTKADKLSSGAAKAVVLQVQKQLKELEYDNVTIQTFSSLKRTGAETVMEKMDEWLGYPKFATKEVDDAQNIKESASKSVEKNSVKGDAEPKTSAKPRAKPKTTPKPKATPKPKLSAKAKAKKKLQSAKKKKKR